MVIVCHGPLTRYVKLGVVHAPGMPGTFSPPPQVNDLDMHYGTCMTPVPWCMPGSLTSGCLWSRWRENVPLFRKMIWCFSTLILNAGHFTCLQPHRLTSTRRGLCSSLTPHVALECIYTAITRPVWDGNRSFAENSYYSVERVVAVWNPWSNTGRTKISMRLDNLTWC